MDEKLTPAHVQFARWFIRIRWIALILLILSISIVKYIFGIPVQEKPIYILALVLLLLNIIHSLLIRRITEAHGNKIVPNIKLELHFQIITDLMLLTLILHFSGGIENPLFLFYFFHLIIASSIFSTFISFLHAAFVLLLASSLALLECYSIIPHYHLATFAIPDLYRNTFFILGTGFIFVCTSVMIVRLSHLIIFRSIQNEENYARMNQELEKKDQLKNEYVLRVTHDIKGHLAAILSCIEVIRSRITGPLNTTQEEFAQRAYERTELLASFVKNLLNLTKKRLKRDYEFEEIKLKNLIMKIVAPIQILARDKSIDFNISIDNTIHTIMGCPYTLEELYSNLLLNAVKYTPPHGHITLVVKNLNNQIYSEISDSGIGIPKDDLPNVFNEFYRASNVPKDFRTGSGLGLSIAKLIVESHKGKIWVSSELGVWTKFSFTLPKLHAETE